MELRPTVPAIRLLLLALTIRAVGGPAAAEEPRLGWERYVAPLRATGAAGIAWFPTTWPAGLQAEVLDPRGFRVHFVDPSDPGVEIVHPAGVPFLPPAGRWRIWIAGRWGMSPDSRVAVFPPPERTARGFGVDFVPVLPAGRVAASPETGLPAGAELWLLAAGNDPRRYELSRRRPAAEAAAGVLMPAGPALAAAWDPAEGRYLALAPPFRVIAGETVPAPLAPSPPERSAFIAYVEHPSEHDRDSHHGVELVVASGGAEIAPDATVTTAWGLHAVWYDLPAGPAELRGGNGLLYLEPKALELTGGEIGDLRATLSGRPLLDVALVLPREVRERPFSLAVRRVDDGRELARVQLRRDAGRHRFRAGLEKAEVELVLETHLGRFRRRIDLASEPEATVQLAPELIALAPAAAPPSS